MSRKNQPAWTPLAEHAALLPPFSGNEFNGWGEAGLRRPRQIFWLRKPEGHPYARLSKVPSSAEDPEGQLEVCDQYNRGARVVMWLSHWIRAQGYEARPHAGPWVGSLALLPAAIACGFGELGKHGSLINREYGASFRLAAVETDLPLQYDVSDSFGADDFCTGCQVCTNECPPDAISREKVLVRGTVKWAVDFDRCIAYFNETYGCGICLAVCPWSTPGRAPKLAQRFARRAAEKRVAESAELLGRTASSRRQVGAAGELIAR